MVWAGCVTDGTLDSPAAGPRVQGGAEGRPPDEAVLPVHAARRPGRPRGGRLQHRLLRGGPAGDADGEDGGRGVLPACSAVPVRVRGLLAGCSASLLQFTVWLWVCGGVALTWSRRRALLLRHLSPLHVHGLGRRRASHGSGGRG